MTSIELKCGRQVRQRLKPGQTVTVGRHATNTWPLNEGSVSRFHAQIEWRMGEARPWLTDLGSSNGTFLDGLRLPAGDAILLARDSTLRFGELEFTLERIKPPAGPALLPAQDDQNTVVMLGDSKAACEGTLRSWKDLRALLARLESKQRSGVVRFEYGQQASEVTLLMGALALEQSAGCALLLELRDAPLVSYRYSPQLETGTCPEERWRPSELYQALLRRSSRRADSLAS